jgi:hypothetical protein
MRYALVLLLLAGCAANEVAQVQHTYYRTASIQFDTHKKDYKVAQVAWIPLPDDEVKKICGPDLPAIVFGCHRMRDGVHFIITREPKEIEDNVTHCNMGHELRHVFEGDFHGNKPMKKPCGMTYNPKTLEAEKERHLFGVR